MSMSYFQATVWTRTTTVASGSNALNSLTTFHCGAVIVSASELVTTISSLAMSRLTDVPDSEARFLNCYYQTAA